MLVVANLSEPLVVQHGDRFERHGSMLLQIRRVDNQDVVIKSATILPGNAVTYGTYATIGSANNVTQVVMERIMPGALDSIVSVMEANDGKVTFTFGSGAVETSDSWQDLAAFADEIDADGGNSCRKFLRGLAYRSSPTGANKTALVGASIATNLQPDSVPVVFTPPLGS